MKKESQFSSNVHELIRYGRINFIRFKKYISFKTISFKSKYCVKYIIYIFIYLGSSTSGTMAW